MRARMHGRVGYWILRERKEIEFTQGKASLLLTETKRTDRQKLWRLAGRGHGLDKDGLFVLNSTDYL